MSGSFTFAHLKLTLAYYDAHDYSIMQMLAGIMSVMLIIYILWAPPISAHK